MDSQKFDSLAKTLASPSSRRRIVKGAAVAGLGSLLAFGGQQTTEASHQCPGNKERCGPICCPKNFVCIPREQRCAPRGQA